MSTIPIEVQSQLDDIERLVLLHDQERKLNQVDEVKGALSPLLDHFSDIRTGRSPNAIPNLGEIVDGFQVLLLNLAEPDSRRALQREASLFAGRMPVHPPELRGIAVADLLLRKLYLLCIQSAAHQHVSDIRIPRWNLIINAAQNSLTESERHWNPSKI